MAVDATDLGALEKALNDASGKASVLWTTVVTFELYLASGPVILQALPGEGDQVADPEHGPAIVAFLAGTPRFCHALWRKHPWKPFPP